MECKTTSRRLHTCAYIGITLTQNKLSICGLDCEFLEDTQIGLQTTRDFLAADRRRVFQIQVEVFQLR